MGGWKQWCGAHRGRENFDSIFCTMVRNPFWSPGYSLRAVIEVWEEEWKQPHCHIEQSRLFSPSQACSSSCTSPFSEWWPHLPTSIRNDPSFQTPLCVFKCCWSCLHLIPLPSSPSQWPLLWFRPSFLSIRFQTHRANFCLKEPCKYRSDVTAPLRALNGVLKAFRVKSDLPYISLLCLYIQTPFPLPPPIVQTHTYPPQ